MATDTQAPDTVRAPVSRVELVAILAMLAATVAFSIDAMLPVLPDIAADLNPAEPQSAQLIIAAFAIGLGVGTLFAGPLSDAFGRRPIAVGGAVIYTLAALYAARAQSLDALLIARAVQGLGGAGPRVTALAIVRDLFAGRQMARIVSFIMIVFSLVPVLAPAMGAAIAWAFGWRMIFLTFAVFSVVSIAWLLIRLPETLAADDRRPFRVGKLADGIREVFTHRQVLLSIGVQTLLFGMLFASLMSSQAVFGEVFGRAESFPYWFGLMAALSALSGLINAAIVVRYGMRAVVMWSLFIQAAFTAMFLLLQLTVWQDAAPSFAIAFLWMTSIFFLAGLGIGNMNAIALEPMGHIAGMASSVVSAASTVGAIALAAPIGQRFDGTMLPLTIGVLVLGTLAFLLTRALKDSDA